MPATVYVFVRASLTANGVVKKMALTDLRSIGAWEFTEGHVDVRMDARDLKKLIQMWDFIETLALTPAEKIVVADVITQAKKLLAKVEQ